MYHSLLRRMKAWNEVLQSWSILPLENNIKFSDLQQWYDSEFLKSRGLIALHAILCKDVYSLAAPFSASSLSWWPYYKKSCDSRDDHRWDPRSFDYCHAPTTGSYELFPYWCLPFTSPFDVCVSQSTFILSALDSSLQPDSPFVTYTLFPVTLAKSLIH